MKPTEQDKELRKKIEKIPIAYSSDQGGEAMYFEDFVIMPSDIDDFYDELIKLITADRERVALEARLQEVEVSIIELERSDDPRFYSKDEAIRSQRARYTQLKAKQEEV